MEIEMMTILDFEEKWLKRRRKIEWHLNWAGSEVQYQIHHPAVTAKTKKQLSQQCQPTSIHESVCWYFVVTSSWTAVLSSCFYLLPTVLLRDEVAFMCFLSITINGLCHVQMSWANIVKQIPCCPLENLMFISKSFLSFQNGLCCEQMAQLLPFLISQWYICNLFDRQCVIFSGWLIGIFKKNFRPIILNKKLQSLEHVQNNQ